MHIVCATVYSFSLLPVSLAMMKRNFGLGVTTPSQLHLTLLFVLLACAGTRNLPSLHGDILWAALWYHRRGSGEKINPLSNRLAVRGQREGEMTWIHAAHTVFLPHTAPEAYWIQDRVLLPLPWFAHGWQVTHHKVLCVVVSKLPHAMRCMFTLFCCINLSHIQREKSQDFWVRDSLLECSSTKCCVRSGLTVYLAYAAAGDSLNRFIAYLSTW